MRNNLEAVLKGFMTKREAGCSAAEDVRQVKILCARSRVYATSGESMQQVEIPYNEWRFYATGGCSIRQVENNLRVAVMSPSGNVIIRTNTLKECQDGRNLEKGAIQ